MAGDETINVSVIITGPDDMSIASTKAILSEQTLQPCEVRTFIEPMPDQLREAIRDVQGDYIYVMCSTSGFNTEYSLERKVRGKILNRAETGQNSVLPTGFRDEVFKKGELPEDAAEILAWPESFPQDVQTEPLPDGLRRRLAGVAMSLWPLDVLPLAASFFRFVYQLAQVYPDEADQQFFCALLHVADYLHLREFMCNNDWAEIRIQLDVLHNHAWEHVPLPDVRVATRVVQMTSDCPAITYVVPVCNVGRRLSHCIESLRRQTLPNIEILCVDDGSTDDSPEILDAFARRDSRIRVFHRKNEGVGCARNFALSVMKGEYVSFVDGDDWLDADAARTAVDVANRHALDFCAYDISAFDHKTRSQIPFYWSIAEQAKSLPVDRIVQMSDFAHLMINASACLAVYRKTFLDSSGISFTSLRLGEDLTFTMTIWPRARRFMLLNRAFYHYRRGQSYSSVSNLTAGVATKAADDAQISMMEALLKLYRAVYKERYSARIQSLFRERVLADILYYAEKSHAVRTWLADVGWRGFDFDSMQMSDFCEGGLMRRWEKMTARLAAGKLDAEVSFDETTPAILRAKLKKIERARKSAVKDIYIVTGQLNSTTNEPIDSWTFFQWLQKSAVPSRYVLWKRHPLYARLRDADGLKDVIVLDGDGVGNYEFVSKCADVLVHAKAVVQENAALNSCVRTWLRKLDGCAYVFLQHGVFYTWFTPVAANTLSLFNYINVASERERDFILHRMPESVGMTKANFIVAGLPRWDSLRDMSSGLNGENVVFVMLTWRMSLGMGEDRLENSAYLRRLRHFLSPCNLQKLRSLGIRVVFAPHHHLAGMVKSLDFGTNVEMATTNMVSYWIRRAKMIVTDFSSVSIDFLFQGKPVVYWMLDADDLRLNRANANDGGKVSSAVCETKALFNQVFSESAVMALIERYARNGFALEQEKRIIADSLFANKSDVSRRLYEGIEEAYSEEWG